MDCTFSLKQTALLYACRVIGGRKLLARKIGATASQIGNWINRGDKIPYHYTLLIVKEARGVVTLDQLCPDMHHVNKLVMQSDKLSVNVPINVIHYNERNFLLRKQVCKRRGNLNPVTETQMDIITRLCVPSECVIVAEIIKERLGQRQGRPTNDEPWKASTYFNGRKKCRINDRPRLNPVFVGSMLTLTWRHRMKSY